MNRLNKILSFFLILLLLSSFSAEGFRDAGRGVNEAAEGFTDEGLFGSFIFKYGETYFRPEGNVSREDLLLVLSEYHSLTRRLLDQSSRILTRLDSMERRGLSSSDVDMVMREFQRNLDPMLRGTDTIRELREREITVIGDEGEAVEVPDYSRRLEEIEAKISALDEREDADDLSGELASLRRQVSRIEREAGRRPVREEAVTSAVSDSILFPFWARLSIGFSVLTLFFISR